MRALPYVTRRRTRPGAAALVVLALLAVGCGGEQVAVSGTTPGTTTGTASESATASTRTIEHFAGTTEVPADPQRIVTLQDQNALLPLLELGVRPVASAGLVNEDGSHTFRRTEGFDASGIDFVGAYGEPDLEAIAAARPDLIISDEYSAEGVYEQLSQVAPTVFVQVFDRPLTDALEDYAEVVGEQEQAAQLRAAYDARIDELRGALGDDLERTSVSLLSTGDPGTFYQADSGGQAHYTVMRDLGLPRPGPQREGAAEDFAEYSLEQLPEHDADAVIVTDFSGEAADPGVPALVESRLHANLTATQAGQSYVIDATKSVGSAWARMDVFIDELERILLDPDFDHDVVQEAR